MFVQVDRNKSSIFEDGSAFLVPNDTSQEVQVYIFTLYTYTITSYLSRLDTNNTYAFRGKGFMHGKSKSPVYVSRETLKSPNSGNGM